MTKAFLKNKGQFPTSFTVTPLQATAELNSRLGVVSVITYLRKIKMLYNGVRKVGEKMCENLKTLRSEKKEREDVLQALEQMFCSLWKEVWWSNLWRRPPWDRYPHCNPWGVPCLSRWICSQGSYSLWKVTTSE